jgi:hypothetical protein
MWLEQGLTDKNLAEGRIAPPPLTMFLFDTINRKLRWSGCHHTTLRLLPRGTHDLAEGRNETQSSWKDTRTTFFFCHGIHKHPN